MSGMLELTVDLQLNPTDRKQGKRRFRSSRLHEIADPELPLPDPRRFRSRQQIFHAFVIHGEVPACRLPPAPTEVEPKSSICSIVHIAQFGGRQIRQKPFPNALRRASGVWSLGGAGLFPE
jgi:hypothetical protein